MVGVVREDGKVVKRTKYGEFTTLSSFALRKPLPLTQGKLLDKIYSQFEKVEK